jgi:DNA-binding NarL/FixJ family response regulator
MLVIDRNRGYLRMLVNFLEEHAPGGLHVVGATTNIAEAHTLAAATEPTCALIGIEGDTAAALALITALRAARPQLRIIAIAQPPTEEYRTAALAAGADRLLNKASLHRQLLPALAQLFSS